MTPLELKAARIALGEEPADDASHDEVLRMRATLDTLRAWAALHGPLPVPAPKRARGWLPALVAAALLAAVGIVLLRAKPPGIVPPPPVPVALSKEVEWIAAIPPDAEKATRVWIDIRDRGQGVGGPPPPAKAPPALDAFVGQFAFPFRVPTLLPGGYGLVRGQPLSEERVRLVYELEREVMTVYLSRSEGPDRPFEAVRVAGRALMIARRGNLLIAIEPPSTADPVQLADLFIKEEK